MPLHTSKIPCRIPQYLLNTYYSLIEQSSSGSWEEALLDTIAAAYLPAPSPPSWEEISLTAIRREMAVLGPPPRYKKPPKGQKQSINIEHLTRFRELIQTETPYILIAIDIWVINRGM